MTSIEKLRISGVRSFSPSHPQTIAFQKPLTLIVGKNGSGKTTIIECLKMATTGSLPPHVNGQQFINDPALHSVTETKAQIKLKLTAPRSRGGGRAQGQPMVCVRSFSLTQKNAKKEYKALESALQTIDERGQKQCLSYRCADLNKLLPELMGVSPAVLESVIFVHQEDSCWPLAEDKVLKEKFDSIFASEKFTKALDELRKSKNEWKQTVKIEQAHLGTIEEKLKNVNRLREEQEAHEQTAAELKLEIEKSSRALDQIELKISPLEATRDRRDQLQSQANSMENEHRGLIDRIATARQKILQAFDRELSEDDARLTKLKEEHGSFTFKMKEQIRGVEGKIRGAETERELAEKRKDETQVALSTLEADAKQHAALQVELATLLRRLASDMGVQETQAEGAVESVSRELMLRQEELRAEKERWNQAISSTTMSLHELRARVDGSQSAAIGKETEAATLERKQNEIADHIERLASQERRQAELQEQVRNLRSEILVSEEEMSSRNEAASLQTLRPMVRQLKDNVRRLMEEHHAADAESERRARVARLKQQAENSNERLTKAISERSARLERTLGCTGLRAMVENGRLSHEWMRIKAEREQAAADAQQDYDLLASRVQSRDASLQVKMSTCRASTEEANELEAELRKFDPLILSNSFDFVSARERLESELSAKRETLGQNAQLLVVLKRAVDFAEKQSKCSICDQDCSADVVGRIRSKHDRFQQRALDPANDQRLTQEIRDLEARARGLLKAEESFRKLKHLREVELPAKEKDVAAQRAELTKLKEGLSAKQKELNDGREAATQARELRADCDYLNTLYDTYCKELSEVEVVRSSAQSGMGLHVREKEIVKAEWDEQNRELEQSERKIEQLESILRSRTADLQELQQKKQSKELELARLDAEMATKAGLESQLSEIASRRRKLLAEAKAAREAEAPLREEARQAEAELARQQAQADAMTAVKEERVGACQTELVGLRSVADKLQRYAAHGGEARLVEARERSEAARQNVDSLRARLRELREELDLGREVLQKKETLSLEIDANLEYRQLRADAAARDSELRTVRAEIQSLPQIGSVDADLRTCYAEQRQKQLSIEKMKGALDAVSCQVNEARKQLRQKGYAKVDDEHAKKLIEVKTMLLAIKDIDSYEKALARALMKFHQSKMEDINRSVKELWNKTYKGTDIDGIEIFSEHQGETSAGNRKISYRVVMRKGETTLDMRGRCSAGQKVLACLVIRLALAESFCLNCGILALDEPTTNLDRANSESFAQALNEVIRHRRQQDNFQLLVITHDEAFVEMLGRSENASKYYRVSKAFEGGVPYSTIEEVDIERFG